jgi:hypothetical protein
VGTNDFAAVGSVGDCPVANAYFHMLKSKVLLVFWCTDEIHVWICTNVDVFYDAVLVVQVRSHADAGLFLAGLSARCGWKRTIELFRLGGDVFAVRVWCS